MRVDLSGSETYSVMDFDVSSVEYSSFSAKVLEDAGLVMDEQVLMLTESLIHVPA
jgi:hypothetical protein